MKKGERKITNRKELKNKIMILAATVGLLSGLYGAGAMASSMNSSNHEGLVKLIANKFSLSEEEVEETLSEYREEHRAERQAEMKARFEEKLSEAVSEGKISEEQKSFILAKREEMREKRIASRDNDDLSQEEKRALKDAHREEMHQWMEDNGIDFEALNLGHQGEGRGRHWK